MKQNRAFYLDNLCGLLILYMIYGYHLADKAGVVESALFKTLNYFFFFFMSWFFFKAGLFHKNRDFMNTIRGSCSRLLIPFFLFNIVGWVVDIIETIIRHNYRTPLGYITRPLYELYTYESSVCNGALWFLFSLFVIKVIAHFLLRNRSIILATLVVSATSAFLLGELIPQPKSLYWVGNIFYGMFFYCLGYILKKYQFNKFLVLFSIIVYMIHFIFPVVIDVRTNYSNNYILNLLFCFTAIISFNFLFKRVFNYKVPLFSYVGRHSMTFYVTHFVFIYALFCHIYEDNLEVFSKGESFIFYSLLVTIYLILMDLLFNRTSLRWMVGE